MRFNLITRDHFLISKVLLKHYNERPPTIYFRPLMRYWFDRLHYVLLLTEAAFAFYGKYSLIPRNAAFHGWQISFYFISWPNWFGGYFPHDISTIYGHYVAVLQ
ncbi:conserved hypothetical protein [Trichinella spiralis]|uniref:hypothetical protein n=1 Tax=Trichinella spiralis TaxID=6334 RepID=UPI0001EFC7FE|nr:conserved hypothetical protein [Trichinella spiralis]